MMIRYRSCSCPLWSRCVILSLSCSRSLSLSLAILTCLLRRAISLSLDWCTVLSNERTLDDALLLPSLLLSLFFLLSLCRITWGEVRGWSVYSLLVNCCWLSCCCRCLWISISRLVMCFYVVALVVVMFSIGYQGKEFVWRCQSRKGTAKQSETWLTSSVQ